MNLPAIPTDLTPATADEMRAALAAIFDQFPSHNSADPGGKYAGYLDALSGEPQWAVERAVRRFLRGEVSSHDGRFLPTSAELARVVREESAYARRRAERDVPRPALTDQRSEETLRIDKERRIKRLEDLSALLSEGQENRSAESPFQSAGAGEVTVGKHLVDALEQRERMRGGDN